MSSPLRSHAHTALVLALTCALAGCALRSDTAAEPTPHPAQPAEQGAATGAVVRADTAVDSTGAPTRQANEGAAAGATVRPQPPADADKEFRGRGKDERADESDATVVAEAVINFATPMPMSEPMPPPAVAVAKLSAAPGLSGYAQPANTENYASIESHAIVRAAEQPVSTFSIDVDTGSYSNVRRMLAAGTLPPKDAVRVEEMINYFDYGYPGPASKQTPFRVSTEIAPSPWNAKRHLLQVGIQGYDVDRSEIPPANLVFLIDTSGSMADPDKLPLVKQSLRQWVPQLRAQDRISIVVYAGAAGEVLPPTPGDRHAEILAALDRLESGGSTNGGDGIRLAYALAKSAYIEGGINRVMLATDGDFNVGTVDQTALETLVEHERKSGVALSTLGFGTGNYNDELAERLADLGNGNHAYIDSTREAHKALVEEMGSTLMTIAADVKIQVEFNPATVAEYRLIGYENRALAREDFDNDRVDAGEIGAGHDVTALYEIALVGSGGEAVAPLRYGPGSAAKPGAKAELAWLKLRYKRPGNERSVLVETPIRRSAIAAAPGERLRFAAAVAAFGDLLRGGEHAGDFGWDGVARLARSASARDDGGHRAEFLQLVEQARALQPAKPVAMISE